MLKHDVNFIQITCKMKTWSKMAVIFYAPIKKYRQNIIFKDGSYKTDSS